MSTINATTYSNSTAATNAAAAAAGDICDDPLLLHLLVLYGALIFILQSGFLILEAGYVSRFGLTNIIFKNVYDTMLSTLAFFILGWAFSFGGDDDGSAGYIAGHKEFFLGHATSCSLAKFVFHAAFACTAVTIISGAMAGRCTFLTYTVYSLILCGFSYPILVHWTWSSTAWLAEGNGDGNGFRDFAGSGVVHMTGGIAALLGCIMIGPRLSRIIDGKFVHIPPHSTAFIGTGTMIIFFGFLFFNGGTAIGLAHNIGDSVNAVPLAITNTILAGASAGVAVLLLHFRRTHYISLLSLTNGILAGCVSSCASAGWVEPWAACIIGIGGGLTYYGASGLLERFRIDDALEASAVHAGAGAWGLIAEAIFHQELGIAYAGDANSFRHLGWQILGIVVIVLWIGLGVVVSLVPLWWYGLLRISARAEKLGIDLFQHHEISWDLQTQMVMDDAERNLPSRIVKNMYSDAHPSRDPSQAGDTGSAVQSLTMPTSLSRVQSLRRRERDFRTGLHDRDGPPPPSPLHHTILVNNDDANRRTLPRDSMTSVVVATEAIEPPPEAQRESVGNEFDFFDSERITSALTSANPKPLSSVDSIYSGKGSVISESCL